MNFFRTLKLELHVFQQYFTPMKQGEGKTTMGPKHTCHTRTIPISKCFHSYVYIKKYADNGTRTNILCFQRLLLARVQMAGLHKEICR